MLYDSEKERKASELIRHIFRILFLLTAVLSVIWIVLTEILLHVEGGFALGDFEPVKGVWGYCLGTAFSAACFLVFSSAVWVPAIALRVIYRERFDGNGDKVR